jgi:hypothetical protein
LGQKNTKFDGLGLKMTVLYFVALKNLKPFLGGDSAKKI